MSGDRRLYSSRLELALRLAARGHYRQFRRGTGPCAGESCDPLPPECVPYLTHLMGTACILARLGASDEVLAAALLHDFLEDVPASGGRAAIEAAAGPEVLALVEAVTEDKRRGEAAPDTWEVRKREQLSALARIPEAAVLIKTADALHNLLSLAVDLESAADPSAVWARFNAPPDRQMWYYRELVAGSRRRLGGHPLADELGRAVDRLTRLLPDREV